MDFTKLLASVRLLPGSITCSKLVRRSCCNLKQDKPPDCSANEDKTDRKKKPPPMDTCNTSGVVGALPARRDSCGDYRHYYIKTRKGLVLGVYETGNKKFELSAAAEEINQKSDGKLARQLNELSCQLKLGRAFAVTGLTPEYDTVALACIGPKEPGYDEQEVLDVTKENIRWGVGAGVQVLSKRCCGHVEVEAAGAPAAAAEAAELAAWRFQEFKTSDRVPTMRVSQLGGDSPEWQAGAARGQAQNWARFLSDMPANMMTPVDLAQHALDMLCPLGVVVEARDRDWIESQNMQAFLAVARGSCTEPVFLECTYRGGPGQAPPVLLAAKGVTFDSGGLCLKPRKSMTENRGSMAGAAVVLGAIKALAETKIENTDMEGRLMLADALVYGQAAYKPALVIDVATLTHGVRQATGGGAFGCFSNSEAAWGTARAAGAETGDRPWRFPLWRYYHKQIVNEPSVDLRNKGAGKATPCIGAAFLKNFVCNDWVHMDITGVGKVAHDAPPYLHPRRMTGRPTRTLALMLQNISQNCSVPRDRREHNAAQP